MHQKAVESGLDMDRHWKLLGNIPPVSFLSWKRKTQILHDIHCDGGLEPAPILYNIEQHTTPIWNQTPWSKRVFHYRKKHKKELQVE